MDAPLTQLSSIEHNVQFVRRDQPDLTAGNYFFCIDIIKNTFIKLNQADLSSPASSHRVMQIEITKDNLVVIIPKSVDESKHTFSVETIRIIQEVFKNSIATKGDPKKREHSPEAKEKTLEHAQIAEKKIKTVLSLTSSAEGIFGKNCCQNIDQHDDKFLTKFAQKIFELANLRLSQPPPLDEKQIEQIYRLLFETELSSISLEAFQSAKHIPITQPLPVAYIFRILFDACENLKKGGKPLRMEDRENVSEFTGTVLILQNQKKEDLWVFKPCSGEHIKRAGIKSGEGAERELACYLLNLAGNFSIVPFTTIVNIGGDIGALQHFVKKGQQPGALEMDTGMNEDEVLDLIHREDLQKCLIFDLLFSNTDRNRTNFLMTPLIASPSFHLFAVDHATCLSNSLKDVLVIDILESSQGECPFSESTLPLIDDAHVAVYSGILNERGFKGVPLRWMHRCVQLLKIGIREGLKHGNGLLWASDITYLLQSIHVYFYTEDNFKEFFTECLKKIVIYKKLLLESESHNNVIERLRAMENNTEVKIMLEEIIRKFSIKILLGKEKEEGK